MRCRYIYSACVVIEAKNCKILCDPWFGNNAFEGAWGQYPTIEDPIETIGPVDLIYISHVHDDHFDPKFLHQYLQRHPAKIVIGTTSPPILNKNLERWCLDFIEITHNFHFGDLILSVVANNGFSEFNFDTALVVKDDNHCLVNLNDNPFDEEQLSLILKYCSSQIDLALLPYTGAGPYPSMYEFESDADRSAAAKKHNEHWLDYFVRYRNFLKPKYIIPFAGKYYLTDEFANRNLLKGNIDPIDLKRQFSEVVVLDDGGDAYIDLKGNFISRERSKKYDIEQISKHMMQHVHGYKSEIDLPSTTRVPFEKILSMASKNAAKRQPLDTDYYVCFFMKELDSQKYLVLDTQDYSVRWLRDNELVTLRPRFEIYINHNLLFGILTQVYIWQSVEYLAIFRRVPDRYDAKILTYFHFLHT